MPTWAFLKCLLLTVLSTHCDLLQTLGLSIEFNQGLNCVSRMFGKITNIHFSCIKEWQLIRMD